MELLEVRRQMHQCNYHRSDNTFLGSINIDRFEYRSTEFVEMTVHQLTLVFVFHLIICQSLLLERNIQKNEAMLNVKNASLASEAETSRIIGGSPTDIEKYPYVVSLQQNGTFFGHAFEHFCVGNIVSENWILTAAKCCYGKNPDRFHVRVGSEMYYDGGQIHEIENIVIHPQYDEMLSDYDVGLLKLRKGIALNEKAQPIKLPKTGRIIQSEEILDIAGWGATELLGWPSDRINNNTIVTISQKDCIKMYARNSVTDRMFCAFNQGNGPCIGDTGSPGVVANVLIGVASWSQSCAYSEPTAYARLPEMVDWIINLIRDNATETNTGYRTMQCTLLIVSGIFAIL